MLRCSPTDSSVFIFYAVINDPNLFCTLSRYNKYKLMSFRLIMVADQDVEN
jgi:hypothetical protein